MKKSGAKLGPAVKMTSHMESMRSQAMKGEHPMNMKPSYVRRGGKK